MSPPAAANDDDIPFRILHVVEYVTGQPPMIRPPTAQDIRAILASRPDLG